MTTALLVEGVLDVCYSFIFIVLVLFYELCEKQIRYFAKCMQDLFLVKVTLKSAGLFTR